MPLYEFRCTACQRLFEVLVRSSDDERAVTCPHCGSGAFERVLSATRYAMGAGPATGPKARTHNCPGGSCTTIDLPGPAD